MSNIKFENREYIAELVQEKIAELKNNKDFEEKYEELSKKIDELENELNNEDKEKFLDIIKLTFSVEEYYFTLAYSLGVKYGEDLKKI